MVKGLKPTSSQIVVSGQILETAPGVFSQGEVDLTLNVLDREVFVVTAVDLNVFTPEGIAGLNTSVNGSLSATSRTSVGTINDSNVLAADVKNIRSAGYVDSGVGFSEQSPDSPTGIALEYIAIISTNNFFAQCQAIANVATRGMNFRVWGYRAQADANTFAALVQSELLSA
tara:strand:- start:3 stop:518 length:516 start_codon:yes stop_codon:yes gene_type:complete